MGSSLANGLVLVIDLYYFTIDYAALLVLSVVQGLSAFASKWCIMVS